MFKRLLLGVAIWIALVGGCFAWSEASRSASQELIANTLPARTDTARAILADSAVALQMFALERHARMDMILSSGPVGPWQRASAGHSLTVVAVTLNAGR